jgi:hypothetical protein
MGSEMNLRDGLFLRKRENVFILNRYKNIINLNLASFQDTETILRTVFVQNFGS